MVKKSEIQNIIVRQAILYEVPQLVALMNAEYNRKKNSQYFTWQFFESVYPTVLMVASVGEKIVGMFGLQKRKLNNGAIVGQAIDMLIDKEWRGTGLFRILANRAIDSFKDIDILCVFPNRNGKRAVEKSLGWKCLSRIDNLTLNLNEYKINSGYKWIRLTNRKSKYFRFISSSEIQKWRFVNHPEYKYTFLKEDKNNYIVIKVFMEPLSKKKIGDIVYVCTDADDLHVYHKLIERAIEIFQKQNISSTSTWELQHTNVYQLMLGLGFKPIPQERYFCVKILNSQFSYLYDIESWDLFQADAELF